jgi:hypothetical protein
MRAASPVPGGASGVPSTGRQLGATPGGVVLTIRLATSHRRQAEKSFAWLPPVTAGGFCPDAMIGCKQARPGSEEP